MKTLKQQLFRATWFGAIILISIYTLVLSSAIMYTENRSSEQRLSIIAPQHFKQFTTTEKTAIKVNPLLTLYNDYSFLPQKIRDAISEGWTGVQTFQFDDDSEFSVFAASLDDKTRTYYAVENVNPIEWSDADLLKGEVIFAGTGSLLFLLATYLIRAQAGRLAKPLQDLVHHISDKHKDDLDTDIVNEKSCAEIYHIETAVNHYRQRMKQMLHREQTFTRYVSHELRTPMMAIKGNVSVLQKRHGDNKQLKGINNALDNVNELIHTFLCLARESELAPTPITLDNMWLETFIAPLQSKCQANQVTLQWQLQEPFEINCEAILLQTLIYNLLDNAINCTFDGEVDLFVSQSGVVVIDSGIGLDEKPRGYEGFGVGLQIVEDICAKYHWQFSLQSNPKQGCRAEVIFV